MNSLKNALRTLSKSPFVTTVAVLSLALGIGANTAIYSLFDQMLLDALPVEAPERLINIKAQRPNHAGAAERVVKMLTASPQATKLVLTGLDHFLIPSRGEIADYGDARRRVDEGALRAVSEWIAGRLR